jgi:hypothetical protein
MSFESLLTSLCTIQSLATAVSAIGESSRSYSAGTQIACRLNPVRNRSEPEMADRTVALNKWRLYIGASETVTEQHRVVSSGNTYNVLYVANFFGHHLEVELERVI